MNATLSLDHHTICHHETPEPATADAPGRAFAARLDMTIKRSRLSSSHVARSLGVAVADVTLWRAGITMPRTSDYRRLSDLLHVDARWLRSGTP